MSTEICDVLPEQQAELGQFLISAFQVPPTFSILSPEMLAWKYFQPRPDWKGSRSKVVREDGRIVAHAGVWPVSFATPDGVLDCVHLIDWAAIGAAGSGVLLYREMLRSASAAIVVGGATGARRLLTRMGFSQVGRVDSYVRVVRPWQQFRSRPSGPPWKNLAKWIRNTGWRMAPRVLPSGWWADPQPQFPGELSALLEELPSCLQMPAHRTVATLNFLLGCPGAHGQAYLLRHREQLAGYFLLCRFGGQTRIADLRTQGGPGHWAAAYSLAIEAAARDPETCEIVAASSCDLTAQALAENGFVVCGERPLWLYDPKCRLAGGAPFNIQPIESDAYCLYDPESPFAS